MENAESELQRHQEAYQNIDDKIVDLEILIGEWLEGHPTFREEIELFDETPERDVPSIGSTRFDVLGQRDEIVDEWSCVFKFGYMKGLIEAHATVDMNTGVPYEDLGTEE